MALFRRFGKQDKDLLQADLDAMKRGDLGLSDGQQTQVRDQAMDSARAGVAAVNANLSRGAGNDPSQLADLRKQGNAAIGQAGAQGGLEANRISTALAEARRAEILSRLGQQVDRGRENRMFAAKLFAAPAQQAVGQAGGAWLSSKIG